MVLESTVYPGVTEDVLGRTVEEVSGLKLGRDFSIGYSPERINPGDKEHGLKNVAKIVSGCDNDCARALEVLYRKIVKAGVFRVKDIKTAEAAKVIENVQRDLNIALVNELSLIFGKMGIDTREVVKAAGTKWNFQEHYPGFVGGHCIPVDPYYLVYRAKILGYEPKFILSGREVNDSMPAIVAGAAINALKKSGEVQGSRVLLVGLTFKKNVKDTRNSPAKKIISILRENGLDITGYDPLLEEERIEKDFQVKPVKSLEGLRDIDCLITVTDHDLFSKAITPAILSDVLNPGAVVADIRGMLNKGEMEGMGFCYLIEF